MFFIFNTKLVTFQHRSWIIGSHREWLHSQRGSLILMFIWRYVHSRVQVKHIYPIHSQGRWENDKFLIPFCRQMFWWTPVQTFTTRTHYTMYTGMNLRIIYIFQRILECGQKKFAYHTGYWKFLRRSNITETNIEET